MRGQRRPWLLAAGIVLAVLGALSVVWLVGSAGDRQSVVAVARAVPFGATVTADDLAVAQVSVDPSVKVVPAGRLDTIVGQVATTNLKAGALLSPGSVEPEGEPGPGRVMVPIAVPADRMPAGGLRAGDRLIAVDTEDTSSRTSQTQATVVRVGAPDVNDVSVVDVTVASSDGRALAVAAANGHVAIIVRPADS